MNCTAKDLECCRVISTAVTEIIRRSLNEEFREKCFKILETSNTKGVEKGVNFLLLEMTTKFKKGKRGTLKRETPQADTSTERTRSINMTDPTVLAIERTETDNCFVPDDINLEEIDNWD